MTDGPDTDRAEAPAHYREALEFDRVELIRSAGICDEANMAIAHWSGVLDRDAKSVTPDHHVITIHLGGAAARREDGAASRHTAARKGTASILPASESTLWSSDGPLSFLHFYLTPDYLSRLAHEISGRSPRAVEFGSAIGRHDPQLVGFATYLVERMSGDTPLIGLELNAWAQLVGLHLLRHYAVSEEPAAQPTADVLCPDKLAHAIDYMEAHLDNNPNLTEIAAETRMSPYHFSRAFKQATGRTPHQFLIDRRVERARELLSNTEDSLASIAYAVGFSSQSHMTSTFSQRLGITPGQYRKERRS